MDAENLQLLQEPSHKHENCALMTSFMIKNSQISKTGVNMYQKAQQSQYTETTYAIA